MHIHRPQALRLPRLEALGLPFQQLPAAARAVIGHGAVEGLGFTALAVRANGLHLLRLLALLPIHHAGDSGELRQELLRALQPIARGERRGADEIAPTAPVEAAHEPFQARRRARLRSSIPPCARRSNSSGLEIWDAGEAPLMRKVALRFQGGA